MTSVMKQPCKPPSQQRTFLISSESVFWPMADGMTRTVLSNLMSNFSRSFAIRNSHFDVLTTYNDTSAYLEIPGYLSSAADPENPVQVRTPSPRTDLTVMFCFPDQSVLLNSPKLKIGVLLWLLFWINLFEFRHHLHLSIEKFELCHTSSWLLPFKPRL